MRFSPARQDTTHSVMNCPCQFDINGTNAVRLSVLAALFNQSALVIPNMHDPDYLMCRDSLAVAHAAKWRNFYQWPFTSILRWIPMPKIVKFVQI
jgi:hypothetical protein